MGAPPSLLLPCNHRETVHAITVIFVIILRDAQQ
jgi:hypothetical protein